MDKFVAIQSWSLVAFANEFGEPSTQETESGYCLVFTDSHDHDTYVSISNKLPAITEEYLEDNYQSLQVVQTPPDAATVARRKARAAEGKKTQMESYVLCPKGESKRKALKLSFLKK